MEKCIVRTYHGDDCMGDVLAENQPRKKQNRIKSITAASKNRGETLHKPLQPIFNNYPDLKVKYHSNYANMYSSVKRKKTNQDPPSKWRSGQPKFDFQKLCIYCGLDCSIIPDPRNNDWRREAYIALSVHHICPIWNKVIDYKTYMEDICEKRNDEWAARC